MEDKKFEKMINNMQELNNHIISKLDVELEELRKITKAIEEQNK